MGRIKDLFREVDITVNMLLGGGEETITERIRTKANLPLIQMIPHFRKR